MACLDGLECLGDYQLVPSEIAQRQIGVVVPSPWQTSPGCFDRSMCVERVEPRGSIILRDQISLSNKLLGVFVIHCGEYLKRVFYRKKEQACNKCHWVNPCRDWTEGVSQEILSASILNETRSPQDCLSVLSKWWCKLYQGKKRVNISTWSEAEGTHIPIKTSMREIERYSCDEI